MLRRLERVLDLRSGELERGLLLFGYLFLVIASFVVGKAVRDALFLDEFGALLLPYADIAVALLVGIWVSLYLRIASRVTLRSLLVGSLVFFAANCLFFWVLTQASRASWLTPVLYVWVGMFGVVAPAQVWTLANYVLTTRQAKRLYGFVGSGATSGWIVGGYITQATVKRFGAESTLILMAVALLIAAVLVDRLWRTRPDSDIEAAVERDQVRPGILGSLRLVGGSRYLMAIAAVVLLSSYTTAVAGWQFRALSSRSIVGRDELAAFFGNFNFYAGLISFGLQWLITGRLLRRLGLGFALFVVPVGVVLGSLGLLTFGTLAAVIALRGIDQVLRYSIDKPTVELLYLPVPAEKTLAAKSFIDTVVWRLGDGLAGATILVAARWGNLAAVQLSWVNLVLLGGWMVAAWIAQRQYVVNLQDSIQHYRLDAERAIAGGLDRNAEDLLAKQLAGDDASEVLYALRMLGAGGSRVMIPAVHGLVAHPSEEVRQEAIRLLDETGDVDAQPLVEKALYDADLHVRTQALLYVAHHTQLDPLDRIEQIGDFEDFSIRAAMVTFLAQPGAHENLDAARLLLDRMLQDEEPRTRVEAARLLELLPDEFEEQIRDVLESDSPEQVRAGIRAVGRLRKRKLVGRVVERLGEPGLSPDAVEALVAFGDRVVGTLRDYLTDAATPVQARRHIPRVLWRIGSQACYAVLAESVQDPDPKVRFRVISALNKLQDLHPGWPLDGTEIDTLLGAEILGHLRSIQALGALNTALAASATITGARDDGMEKELERIFRLLKLLFPHQDLHSAFVGVQSKSAIVHDNALEFLENILGPEMRGLLLPLLDSQVSMTQRVGLANRIIGTQVATPREAVKLLLCGEEAWMRSCAAHAIGALRLAGFDADLARLTDDSDPLLCETARQARTLLQEA